MGTYDRFIKTAKRLIAKYGEKCEWQVNSDTSDDESDEPWKSEDVAPVVHSVKIAFFNSEQTGLETLSKAVNNSVVIGNVVGYMPAVDFKPDMRDTIKRLVAEKNLTLVSIDEINPNGVTPIIYILKCIQ
jgi:hypothetical protein